MIFYKLTFHSFPELRFACCTCTDHYKNIFTYRQNLIEISASHGSAVQYENEDGCFTVASERFNMIMPDMHFEAHALDSTPLFSSTAAITGDFSFERFDSKEIPDIDTFLEQEKDSLLVPSHLTLQENYTEIERLFRLLILQYLKETPASKLHALSLWFEILATISEQFRHSLAEESPVRYSKYYSQKVKRFIEQHYQDKLSVQRIADTLGITPGYLSRVFRQSTGKTVTEFITLTRLYHARQLAYNSELTFAQIAQAVGICDIHYLNRLFHKFYGTSLYACRLTDKEISLYHDKPWDVEILTEDIYKIE